MSVWLGLRWAQFFFSLQLVWSIWTTPYQPSDLSVQSAKSCQTSVMRFSTLVRHTNELSDPTGSFYDSLQNLSRFWKTRIHLPMVTLSQLRQKMSDEYNKKLHSALNFNPLIVAPNRSLVCVCVVRFMLGKFSFFSPTRPINSSHTLSAIALKCSKREKLSNFGKVFLGTRETYEWVVWSYGVMLRHSIRVCIKLIDLNTIKYY